MFYIYQAVDKHYLKYLAFSGLSHKYLDVGVPGCKYLALDGHSHTYQVLGGLSHKHLELVDFERLISSE